MLEVIRLRIRIQEFFWRILQHCEIGYFSTIWLISSDFHENFITNPWKRKSPLLVGSNPHPESGSAVRIWSHARTTRLLNTSDIYRRRLHKTTCPTKTASLFKHNNGEMQSMKERLKWCVNRLRKKTGSCRRDVLRRTFQTRATTTRKYVKDGQRKNVMYWSCEIYCVNNSGRTAVHFESTIVF